MRVISRLFIPCIILVSAMLPTAVSTRAASPQTPPAAPSPFAIRGIKGLYWDGLEKYRLALPWVAAHNMNFLMFCYSSFPASGRDWRADYSADEKAGFKELAAQADKLGVEMCLSFNPGIWSKPPLTYASEADYQLVWNKVKNVHALGIKSFALCLDDINTQLQPADADKYKNLQTAQVDFTNRLWKEMQSLSPKPRLIFCPSAYTTDDAEKHLDYIKKMRDLDPAIFIFWTGPTVCSTTITEQDADKFAQWIGRKPIVWDNYPVNDMFPWRPLMAAIDGRSADLGPAVAGLMANPMKQWHASKIPLATLATYLTDPQKYDRAKALDAAVNEYPTEQHDALRALLAVYGTTFLGQVNYPPKPLLSPAPGAKAAAEQLARYKLAKEKLINAKGLEALWADVQPTLDADLAAMEPPQVKP